MKIDWSDILLVGGVLAICVGIGLIYIPAAIIFLGISMITGSVVISLIKVKDKTDDNKPTP
jgi:hypothetical protein